MTAPNPAPGDYPAGWESGPSLDSSEAGSDLLRIRIDVAYDGTDFSGWAVQTDRRTVQGDIQDALATILRRPAVRLTGAGRTDAGVHALAQVAHFDLDRNLWAGVQPDLVRRLAGVLAADVRVVAAEPAPAGFDARFSALWRRYEYRLSDAVHGAEPGRRRDTATWPRRLNIDDMNAAVPQLLGVHDFAAYCRHREGATTVRGLQELEVRRDGSLVLVHARADAFCHSMVRSLVGALIAVGEGRRAPDWPGALLASEERSGDVRVAPARGLTLMEIRYPADDELTARAAITRNTRVSD